MKKVNIAILGFGNIGVGVYQGIEINREFIARRTGLELNVKRILEVDIERPRPVNPDKSIYTQNVKDIYDDPDISIVVEVLGGIHPASDFMIDAMNSGKNVVTANKAAVADRYEELIEAEKRNNVKFRFEASVGGGIPILNSLMTVLRGNKIEEVRGILNGTTNYILTQMTNEGRAYDDVLKEAQEKGFAEADPTADVEGLDVANKLSILITLTFGEQVRVADIPTEGINKITPADIAAAKKGGKIIKLLGNASMKDGNLEYSVAPVLLEKEHPLAGVSNEFNAVYVVGNLVGELMFYGKGAGPLPTGSAIIGDILSIARED
ncbi:MAG: homoserine dehydrogenase [Clostridiales Family XIII bacterium]|jgi:homoserine dehydrogenase|nr:homoserine dehydrogenase [Clostridiales Family XIII bacterium]